MVIYSKAKDDADDDLEFKLKRSIQLVKENKVAKKNGKKKAERATVSRERRLALALRAVLDATAAIGGSEEAERAASDDAIELLHELGYGGIQSIPSRMKQLNEQLKAAVDAGDGKEISRLGLEIERAKAGKEPMKVEAPERAKTDAASA